MTRKKPKPAEQPGSPEDMAEYRLLSFIADWSWPETEVSAAGLYESMKAGNLPAEFQALLCKAANLREILNSVFALEEGRPPIVNPWDRYSWKPTMVADLENSCWEWTGRWFLVDERGEAVRVKGASVEKQAPPPDYPPPDFLTSADEVRA